MAKFMCFFFAGFNCQQLVALSFFLPLVVFVRSVFKYLFFIYKYNVAYKNVK